jgi:hypothetical protein
MDGSVQVFLFLFSFTSLFMHDEIQPSNDKPLDGRPLHNEVFEAMERMYDFSVEYIHYI